MHPCACMGIKEGDMYCYCQLKQRGMDTSHYEWTEQEKEDLNKALSDMFGWKEKEMTFNAKLIAVTQPVVEGMETLHDLIAYCARVSNPSNQMNMDTAEKLTSYLMKHKHWSPFEMANCVVEVNCPRDIARQLLRHRSFAFQEFSQRYADVTQLEEAFCIRDLRLQDTKNRQNSVETEDIALKQWWEDQQGFLLADVKHLYKEALEKGIAKEVARVILPEGLTMSRLYVNGTIRSWIHYLEVRMEEGVTQLEHVILARLIAEQINTVFRVTK